LREVDGGSGSTLAILAGGALSAIGGDGSHIGPTHPASAKASNERNNTHA
jgi:hypothetical protein